MILLPSREQSPIAGEPFHRWSQRDETAWLDFYKSDDGSYLLRFPDLADFIVSGDGVRIACAPVPGVNSATFHHLFVNQVLPLARSRSGKLAFHASAVEVAGGAIAFFGLSGRGKSTLAASFASNRCPFLTDDGLFVEQRSGTYYILPNEPSIRLWEDSQEEVARGTSAAESVSYTTKGKLLAGSELVHCGSDRGFVAAYFLGDAVSANVRIRRLNPAEAAMEWVRQSFLLDVEDQRLLEGHFHRVVDIVSIVPSFALDYPRVYEFLPEVRRVVADHVKRIRSDNECGI